MMPSAWSVGTFGWWTSQLSGMWKMLPLNSWKSRAPFGWFIGQKFRGQMLNFPWGYDLPVNNWAGSIRNSVFLLFLGCYYTAKVLWAIHWTKRRMLTKYWYLSHLVGQWPWRHGWCHRPNKQKDIFPLKKKKENKSSSNEESTSLSKWIEAG